MIEFISLARKRGVIADILHAAFNLLFAVAVTALVIIFPDTPWPALVLVLLAKWRVIAVRPRYWWINFLGSLPDLMLGFGVVVLMWQAQIATLGSTTLVAWPVQVALGLFYAVWLIVIKPQHKHNWVLIQSGLSQFVSLMALFSIAYRLPLAAAVILGFVATFAAARQVLGLHEEKSQTLLSLVWGLAAAELVFAAWHWTVAYQITPLLKIPQIAIIIAVLGFVAERAYAGWRNNQVVQWREISLPLIFALAVIFLLIFGFSGLWA